MAVKPSFKLHKRGFFFTVTAIVFIVVIILFFTAKSRYNLTSRAIVVNDRVETMNNFIIDLEKDAARGLYISGYRAILSLLEDIQLNNGTYIDDFDLRMREAMLLGTVRGRNTTLMEGSLVSDWMNSAAEQGGKLNIDVDFIKYSLYTYQSDPWHVTVAMNATIELKDTGNLASWYVDDSFTSEIDIRGFEDPLYTKNSNGRGALLNLVNSSYFENNFTYRIDGQWNTTNLHSHMENGYYIYNPDAPSFSMKFTGNFGNSTCCGIESLVNLQKRNEQGLPIYQRSIVDHVYFSGVSTTNHNINWTPSWFRIDNNHTARYNITAEIMTD